MRRIALVLALLLPTLTRAADPPKLDWDPAIRRGTLDNGLTYFVRHHDDPKGRFSVRVVLRVGSLVERDDERGLMHLLEHLSFDGSKHFARGQMWDRLVATGTARGADTVASTSYDDVKYQLELPSAELPLALDVIDDWIGGATLSDDAIDTERGIVLAEKRMRADARGRLQRECVATSLAGLPHPERSPIGTDEVITGASPATIRALYARWWRPELVAVVIVGDVDADVVAHELTERLATRSPGADRPNPPAPLTAIEPGLGVRSFVDPGLPTTAADFAWLRVQPLPVPDHAARMRAKIVGALGSYVVNARFKTEGARHATWWGVGREAELVRGVHAFVFHAEVGDAESAKWTSSCIAELRSLAADGPTATELASAKVDAGMAIERTLKTRDSPAIANVVAGDWLDGDVTSEPEVAAGFATRTLAAIEPADVAAWMASVLASPRLTLVVSGSHDVPDESVLRAALKDGESAPLSRHEDVAAPVRLLRELPVAGAIRQRRPAPEVGGEWLLFDNGVRLLVVPTSFEADEVKVAGWRMHEAVTASDALAAAHLACAGASLVGTLDVSPERMQPWLSSHRANVSFRFAPLTIRFDGEAMRDVDPLFQRLHALMTRAAFDTPDFASLRSGVAVALDRTLSEPIARIQEAIAQSWGMPPTPSADDLKHVVVADVKSAWFRACNPASRWTFVVVGDTTPQAMADAGARWLASLPSETSQPSRPLIARRTLPVGCTMTELPIHAEGSFLAMGAALSDREGEVPAESLDVFESVLETRIMERLRRERGESYAFAGGCLDRNAATSGGVFVLADVPPADRVACAAIVRSELGRLVLLGPTAEETAVAVHQSETELRDDLETNDGLLAEITSRLENGEPLRRPGRILADLRGLTADDVRRDARAWIDLSRTFEIVTVPETGG